MKGLLIKIIGRFLKNKIRLEEGTAMETKKWYKSKGVWTGVFTVLIGAYEGAKVSLAPQLGWTLPDIPPLLYTLLGALGVYSRVVATEKIS